MAESHRSVAMELGCTSAEAELWSLIGDALDAAPGDTCGPIRVRNRRRFREAVTVYVSERNAGRVSIASLARILAHIHSDGPPSVALPGGL